MIKSPIQMNKEIEVSNVSVLPKTAEILSELDLVLKKTEIPGQQCELIIPKDRDSYLITNSIVITGFKINTGESNLNLIIGYRYTKITPEQINGAFTVLASRMSTYKQKRIKLEFLEGVDSETMDGIVDSWNNKMVSEFIETFLPE